MDIGTMLLYLVGLLIIAALVWAIVVRLGLPVEVQKWLIIGFLVILLILAINFFLRGGAGIGGVHLSGIR